MKIQKVCSIKECGKPSINHGWCSKHYGRYKRNGNPLLLKQKIKKVCIIEGCTSVSNSLKMCIKHYARYRRTGDPLAIKVRSNSIQESEGARFCTKCKLWKLVDYFYKDSGGWKRGVCISCVNIMQKANWVTRSAESKASRHGYWVQYKYGISITIYKELFTLQNGACAICKQVCNSGRRLAVDHDHKTGEVRGLLCSRCNKALERLDKVPGWAQSAENYLVSQSSP